MTGKAENMRDELIFFTNSFPFGEGEQFIETEIKYLSKAFKRIYIMPVAISDKSRYVPSNCTVDKILLTKNIF